VSEKKYRLAEIFYSVQGEGTWTGKPMVFVRTAGCNLRCSWCDTDFKFQMKMTKEEIAAEVDRLAPPFADVCFTGGEPTLAIDWNLIDHLYRTGHDLHIETNGMFVLPSESEFKSIVVSPKLPGRLTKNWDKVRQYWDGLTRRSRNTCTLKVVWDTSEAFHLKEILDDWSHFQWIRKYIQPLWLDGKTNAAEVLEEVKKRDGAWLISVQTHKDLGER
jgi:organic radical activating enzyme